MSCSTQPLCVLSLRTHKREKQLCNGRIGRERPRESARGKRRPRETKRTLVGPGRVAVLYRFTLRHSFVRVWAGAPCAGRKFARADCFPPSVFPPNFTDRMKSLPRSPSDFALSFLFARPVRCSTCTHCASQAAGFVR